MRIPIYNNIILYTIGALAGTCFIIGISALIEKYFKRNWFYKAMVYEGQNTVIMLSLNRVVQKLIVEKIYYNTIYHLFSNSLFERYVYVIFEKIISLRMEKVPRCNTGKTNAKRLSRLSKNPCYAAAQQRFFLKTVISIVKKSAGRGFPGKRRICLRYRRFSDFLYFSRTYRKSEKL